MPRLRALPLQTIKQRQLHRPPNRLRAAIVGAGIFALGCALCAAAALDVGLAVEAFGLVLLAAAWI